MFDKKTYTERREQLKSRLGLDSGLVLLPGNPESCMNYAANCYPFRQDSTFLYYTGLDKPDLVYVLDIDGDTGILFGNEQTMDEIIWSGRTEPLGELADRAGISLVKPASQLESFLKKAQQKKQAIHFLPPYRPEHRQQLSAWLGIPGASLPARPGGGPAGKQGGVIQASPDLIRAVAAQRSIKSGEEVRETEQAVNTTVAMQLAAMQHAREGIKETELAGQLQGMALSAGGNLAFPSILTVNGQVLHNHPGSAPLQKGQMVLCDCGAETALHYAGDLTRTFPVSGTFSPRQKEIYGIVLKAQQAAIAALQPGKLFKDIHILACETLAEGLKEIGLMKGDTKEAVAQGAHALFFQCGLGHLMGLDVHDMENLGEQYVGYTPELKKSSQFGLKSLRLGRALEPGFVLTVEPGIYFIPELIDLWKAEKKFTDFICYDRLETWKDSGGIRIEDDLLITPDGSRVLGTPLPKTPDEIESIRTAALDQRQ